jgi:hypothetical protein
MKYRHHLHHYENNVKTFQSSYSSHRVLEAMKGAQLHASELRRFEYKRRNGRKRNAMEIQIRQNKRDHDLKQEHEQGRLQRLLPVFPPNMPCSIRCGPFFYPFRIVTCSPGKMIIESEYPSSSERRKRVMTYRLLRKKKNGSWFGLWIEKYRSCKSWHDLDKGFHVNVSLDTSQGRVFVSPWKNWEEIPPSSDSNLHYETTRTVHFYPPPV